MFAFISKFLPQRSESTPQSNRKKDTVSPLLQTEEKNREAERHTFLRRVDASINNEQALLDLLLQCDFADGRLHAAQQIHSKECLERAVKELRNSDKRVAKLMTQRLEKIQKKEALLQALQACVKQAQAMLAQECILANQVIDLDKAFSALRDLSPEEKHPFEQVRTQIAQQLDQQMRLQRELLDLQRAMETHTQDAQSDVHSFVQRCEQQLADTRRSPLLASLPRHLLSEVENKLLALHALAMQSSQAVSMATAEQVTSDGDSSHGEDVVQSAALEIDKPRASATKERMTAPLSLAQIEQALQQMETALEQGSVQVARQFERELKEINPKQAYLNLKLSSELKARLTAARNEMNRLMSWAKWSGTVSRDELVATAEGLASLKLKPAEIVDTVSALRAQWKQMEGGAAAKDLWERFDAACSAAYAPASEHFREQAEQRKANLLVAQAWLLECQNKLDDLMAEPIAWKAVQTSLFDMQQHWRNIGALDRKEKLELERSYTAMCEGPALALAQRQQQEQASRLALIAQVQALDPSQKASLDQLKSIQARWQAQSASIPLKRKDEQSLWEKFRAACDAVFEEKRRHLESADQQRQTNLASKQALCEQAEALQLQDEKEVRAFLHQLNKDWQDIGAVPRQQEHAIEKRLEKIIAQLSEHGRNLTRQKQAQKMQTILQQTALCQQLETQLCERDVAQIAVPAITAEWQELGSLSNPYSSVIQTRFAAALAAVKEGNEGYRQTLATNRATFDDLMLHLEILAGVDSPENLSRERLQKQVQVLQASMKNGSDKSQQSALFTQLLSVPVALDAVRQQRWLKLTEKLDAL